MNAKALILFEVWVAEQDGPLALGIVVFQLSNRRLSQFCPLLS